MPNNGDKVKYLTAGVLFHKYGKASQRIEAYREVNNE